MDGTGVAGQQIQLRSEGRYRSALYKIHLRGKAYISEPVILQPANGRHIQVAHFVS